MPDYINRQDLLEHMKDVPTWEPDIDPTSDQHIATKYPNGYYFPEDVISSIENAPTADVECVIHARWTGDIDWDENKTIAKCTNCGEEYDCTDSGIELFAKFHHYCSNCGARMDDMKEAQVKPKESPKYLPGVEMHYENCSTPVSSLRLPNVDEVAARFGLQRKNGETDNELYGRILHEFLQNPYLDEEEPSDE